MGLLHEENGGRERKAKQIQRKNLVAVCHLLSDKSV